MRPSVEEALGIGSVWGNSKGSIWEELFAMVRTLKRPAGRIPDLRPYFSWAWPISLIISRHVFAQFRHDLPQAAVCLSEGNCSHEAAQTSQARAQTSQAGAVK
jgi:hypothetical protein